MPASTPHALIRTLQDMKEYPRILDMIKDKVEALMSISIYLVLKF